MLPARHATKPRDGAMTLAALTFALGVALIALGVLAVLWVLR